MNDIRASGPPRRHAGILLAIAGATLVAIHAGLAAIAPRFAYGSPMTERPITALVGLLLAAGLAYLLAIVALRRPPAGAGPLTGAIAVGAILRALLLPSSPMLEDDAYRYLWDGAVLAHGMNPYAHAPRDALPDAAGPETAPPALRELARASGDVLGRVNHPSIRTIYPPGAQVAFAAAHAIAPWSLVGWRILLLGFDAATLAILVALLRALGRTPLWAIVYWWSPLVVKELANSAHMDGIALPFVLGALLLAARGRTVWAAGALGIAATVKIWPAILLPLVLRPVLARPRRLLPALALFGTLAAAAALPVWAAGLDASSGLVQYGRRWEMNDALFMVFLRGAEAVARPETARLLARGIALALLFAWIAWLARRPAGGLGELCERALLAVAGLFLVSPTEFPWYAAWFLPLLALRPRRSLLLLTVLLPLYYLRFHLDARDRVDVFDYGIVWLEYVPVWYLLAREALAGRRDRAARSEAVV